MSLSKYERRNLGAFIGGGLLLAVGSVLFRTLIYHHSVSADLLRFQYGLGFAFLGTLLISLIPARTYSAKIAYTLLIFATGLGLLFPPDVNRLTDLVLGISYLLLAVGLGGFYHRFRNPTGALYVFAVTIFSHEFYLFGVVYNLLAFQATGNPVYPASVLLLTVIIHSFRNVLSKELRKTQDHTAFARGLSVFLSPLTAAKDTS